MLAEARIARLGLLDERGAPRVLPVAFAIHEGAIWTAVDRKPKRPGSEPARLRFLRRDPRVALTVDRYEERWDRLAWVQVVGRVSILEASECAGALATLAAKHWQYRVAPPPGPVIRIEPERTVCWRAAPGR